MNGGNIVLTAVFVILAIFVIVTIAKSVRIVQQSRAMIVERLGRFHATMNAGIHLLIPFIDRIAAVVDLREQVVFFPPQPVITSDNLVVSIDSVIYYQVTDPRAATYEIQNFIVAIEQLTITTLRQVIGTLDLEQTLTSRDQINGALRGVLDEATGRWGIRVARVELKAIDPPASIQDSMEKQMRAERDRRAAILTAEGIKQSQVLSAEGEKQARILQAQGAAESAVLEAKGQAEAAVLEANGQSEAIRTVFSAIHDGNPDSKLLAYQYLQMLPQLGKGENNTLWVIPTELTAALQGIGAAMGSKMADSGLDAAPSMPLPHTTSLAKPPATSHPDAPRPPAPPQAPTAG
ncbi:SPFH/Band 7/PHB domain protein [Micrococcales bacterium 31B]|nr:SPFH/Band 7/PHB domain protein [Micrococcales bacterium 31B]